MKNPPALRTAVRGVGELTSRCRRDDSAVRSSTPPAQGNSTTRAAGGSIRPAARVLRFAWAGGECKRKCRQTSR